MQPSTRCPKNGWFVRENPNLKWMIYPNFRKLPNREFYPNFRKPPNFAKFQETSNFRKPSVIRKPPSRLCQPLPGSRWPRVPLRRSDSSAPPAAPPGPSACRQWRRRSPAWGENQGKTHGNMQQTIGKCIGKPWENTIKRGEMDEHGGFTPRDQDSWQWDLANFIATLLTWSNNY